MPYASSMGAPREALRSAAREFSTIESRARWPRRAVQGVLGYGPGTARGRHGFDYIHPEDRDWVIDAFQRILADRSLEVSGEFRIRDAYGTWQWVEAVARNRQDDPALGGIVLSTRNITPRVDAEEAARHSEERFRELVAYASDLVIVLDASGAFVYVSP